MQTSENKVGTSSMDNTTQLWNTGINTLVTVK